MKNKFVAALLGIFGGAFGLHKFYLGDGGAGIFYIFLTMMTGRVFPVAMILGLIDGMRYLMMPPEEFDRKFNKRYKRTSSSRSKKKRREYQYESKRKKKRTRVRSNPFKKSGLNKYKEFDIEDAIEDFNKALKIDPQDASIYFNLACSYSLMEDKEEAFKNIELAVMHGMNDFDRILNHDDLAFVRIQPEFEGFRQNGFKLTNVSSKPKSETTLDRERPSEDILLAQLNRLMELRKKGVLTEQEFLRERKKVLAR